MCLSILNVEFVDREGSTEYKIISNKNALIYSSFASFTPWFPIFTQNNFPEM